MKLYKIKRRTDGLFSTGTIHPKFTTKGKTWAKAQLFAHIALFERNNSNALDYYMDCDIIEYELTETAKTPVVERFIAKNL